ncbi:MAG: SsrA-binding protein SmpB [Phycisphaerales bacterium JB063]
MLPNDRCTMAKRKKHKQNLEPRIENRRARRDYHITDTLECGVVLQGSEVKSIRYGRVSLGEGYVAVNPDTMELWMYNVDIAMYANAGVNQHAPKAIRKLLAHKRQIEKLYGLTTAKGVTLIPIALYFKEGRIKIEVGVGEGKRSYDKRDDIKKRDADRDMRRAMTRKRI